MLRNAVLLTSVALLTAAAAPAPAAIPWTVCYDPSFGVTPDALPGWIRLGTGTSFIGPDPVHGHMDTPLHIHTDAARAEQVYYWHAFAGSSTTGYTAQVTVHLDEYDAQSEDRGAVAVLVEPPSSGDYGLYSQIAATGVVVWLNWGAGAPLTVKYPMDTTDDYHTYHYAVAGDAFALWVDGAFAMSDTFVGPILNRGSFRFGDTSRLGSAHSHWLRVCWSEEGAFAPEVEATLDIDPDAWNLGSRGRWVTAYIELPSPLDVADIDVSSLLLNGVVPAALRPTAIGDHDGDGIPDLMVTFPRDQALATVSPGSAVPVTVEGVLFGGTSFVATDEIIVLLKPAPG